MNPIPGAHLSSILQCQKIVPLIKPVSFQASLQAVLYEKGGYKHMDIDLFGSSSASVHIVLRFLLSMTYSNLLYLYAWESGW